MLEKYNWISEKKKQTKCMMKKSKFLENMHEKVASLTLLSNWIISDWNELYVNGDQAATKKKPLADQHI